MTVKLPDYLSEIDFSLAKYSGSYPREELVKARKRLHEDLHVTAAGSRLELSVKRKCGILTRDLLEFKLEGKRPCAHFNDSADFVTSRFDDEPPEEQREPAHDSPPPAPPAGDWPAETQPEVYVNPTGLEHECEKRFCPRALKCAEAAERLKSVFVCDFCQTSMASPANMHKHLADADHFSASEYLMDACSTVQRVASRSSLRNLAASSLLGVFCPQCAACFGTNTQAAGKPTQSPF